MHPTKKRFVHWIKHLLRSQLLTLLLAILMLTTFFHTAYTDSPLLLRRELEWQNSLLPNSYTSLGAGGVLLHAPSESQLPLLYNGCEVTSLSMLLDYLHINETPIALAHAIGRDKTPLVTDGNGQILSWGDPNRGFVGSISGRTPGFGVYHHPIYTLLNRYVSGHAQDLTGHSFADLLAALRSGRPVIVWTTINFSPNIPWVTWDSPDGLIKTTMAEHAVLLVGYDKRDVYVNNPLNGAKAQPVPRQAFWKTWIEMGRQAVTVTPFSLPRLLN